MLTHKEISFLKSGVRLLGYVLLPVALGLGALVLFGSELLGVWEEWNE